MTHTTFQEFLLTPFDVHEILGFEILSSEKHFCHWEISESLLLVRGLDPCKILLISFSRGSGPPLKSKDTQFAAVKLPKCRFTRQLFVHLLRVDLNQSCEGTLAEKVLHPMGTIWSKIPYDKVARWDSYGIIR